MSEAWVTLTTNDSYSVGALTLAASLKRVGTTRYCFFVSDFDQFFARYAHGINIICIPLDKRVTLPTKNEKYSLDFFRRCLLGFDIHHCLVIFNSQRENIFFLAFLKTRYLKLQTKKIELAINRS